MRLIALTLMFFSVQCVAATLTEDSLTGRWIPKVESSLWDSIFAGDRPNATLITLEVESVNDVRLIRDFDDDDRESVKALSYERVDELFIWRFSGRVGNEYLLVLSGWEIEPDKIMFGYFYLINENPELGLFNGWPVSLEMAGSN